MLYHGQGTEKQPYVMRAGISYRKGLFALCALHIAEEKENSFYFETGSGSDRKLFHVNLKGEGPVQQLPNLAQVKLNQRFNFQVHETVVSVLRIQ